MPKTPVIASIPLVHISYMPPHLQALLRQQVKEIEALPINGEHSRNSYANRFLLAFVAHCIDDKREFQFPPEMM